MPRLSREKQLEKNLNDLYYATVELLLEKVQNGEVIASELSTVVKLLKDSGVLGGNDRNNQNDTIDFPEIDLPYGDEDTEEEW